MHAWQRASRERARSPDSESGYTSPPRPSTRDFGDLFNWKCATTVHSPGVKLMPAMPVCQLIFEQTLGSAGKRGILAGFLGQSERNDGRSFRRPSGLSYWRGLHAIEKKPPFSRQRCACPFLISVARGQTYSEGLRPQFHFSAEKGWLNDPNGLVFYKGEYHLFFQHNPGGTNWVEQLSWGHAISSDAVRWKQFDDVIPPTPRPDATLAGSYSGTGFVDWNNTGGFATGNEKPIILAWTATGLAQSPSACSNGDKGRTFTKYTGNPVIEMPVPKKKGDWDRDPDIFWYEPGKHWVMLYSITGTGFMVNYIRRSQTLETSERHRRFFRMPWRNVRTADPDGNQSNKKWIVWDASSKIPHPGPSTARPSPTSPGPSSSTGAKTITPHNPGPMPRMAAASASAGCATRDFPRCPSTSRWASPAN